MLICIFTLSIFVKKIDELILFFYFSLDVLVLGQFILSSDEPIQLKPGVSLHGTGSSEHPTILTGPADVSQTATIKGME